MTKTAAVKGLAAQALQLIANGPPVVKVATPKLLRGPPNKTRGARPAMAAAKAVPRPKKSPAELQNAIADASGLELEDVKCVLEALRDIAAQSLHDTNVFKLHNIVLIRMRTMPPRGAVMWKRFGKEISLPAKPARQKITAVAAKSLYNAVSECMQAT